MEQTRLFTPAKICTGAMLLATGILLPQVFHMIGGTSTGGMFLPMHIPVLLGGILLGPVYGAILGAFCPAFSFLLTGMPPVLMLPFMVAELIGYGVVAGLMQKKYGNVLLSLVSAQVVGRAVRALSLVVASSLLGWNVPAAASVLASVVTGLPGIVMQIILIPAAVVLLRKAGYFDGGLEKK